jgi:hypothetical protein
LRRACRRAPPGAPAGVRAAAPAPLGCRGAHKTAANAHRRCRVARSEPGRTARSQGWRFLESRPWARLLLRITALTDVRQLAERAKAASRKLGRLDRAAKDRALAAAARLLRTEAPAIAAANARDVERARAGGLTGAMVDRLEMGEKTIASTAAGVDYVATLPDPVGSRSGMERLQNGLLVGRQRLPLGVVAMVYESRPSCSGVEKRRGRRTVCSAACSGARSSRRDCRKMRSASSSPRIAKASAT